MMKFEVVTKRDGEQGSTARTKDARITSDTTMAGRADAFNPAELLLAALSACIIKGIERVTPMLNFSFRSLEVRVNGVRQDAPPLMESIEYTVIIDTDETEQRLELLHENIRKYGTVFNTLSPGTNLTGTVERL